ncbi:MLP-like protein 31 [Silene latifolia]|uniref:MLP-like protein 31 n=1 Tax=Silene latifolia TaxID=37657 RepID=UPI003D7800A5
MGITGKLEIEIDIKHSGDVFHELFGCTPHHVTNIVPHIIHGCDVHEGEFGKPGSIIQWEYTLDGKKCVAKEIVEEIDEEKKLIKFKLIEGSDLLKDFKSMSVTLHVVTKGEIDAILWEINFERFDDFGLYPTGLMDFIIGMTRDVEAHHVK